MTPAPSRRRLAGWLIRLTRAELAPIGLAMLFRVLWQLIDAAILIVGALTVLGVGQALNAGRQAGGVPGPLPAIGWLVALALAKAALRYLEQYSGHLAAFSALAVLRREFLASLLPQAPAATEGAESGELTERATRDIDRVEVFYAHTFPPAVSAVVVPLVALGAMAVSGLAPLALTIAPFTVLVVVVVPLIAGGAGWRAARRLGAARGRIAQELGDSVQGIREVLAFDATRTRLDRLDAVERERSVAASGIASLEAGRRGVITALQWLRPVVLVAVGLATGASVDAIVVALAVAVSISGAERGVDEFVAGLDAAFASAARLFEVMERPPLITDPVAHLEEDSRPAGQQDAPAFAVRDVRFAYPGRSAVGPVLSGVELELPQGGRLRLVGASGSGKSTIAMLAPRCWDPDSGTVEVSGCPVRELPLRSLRGRVALVSQRPYLVRGSVADNVRLAAPDIDDEAVLAALAVAGLDDWVAALPDGAATMVGERGGTLSGGQRQRLALARAVAAEPEVLILDEALSQLDAATEALVRARLERWLGDRSLLEVTHRIDTIPGEAEVAVVDLGRVVERGTAAELRAGNGPFSRLLARV